jgi:hypothetical protein
VLGVGLATLGGLLGGEMRSRFTQQGSPEWRRPDILERAGPRGMNIPLIVVVVALLAALLKVAGIVLVLGAFSATSTALY